MRRRFSRRRRGESTEDARSPLDAAQWLPRLSEAGVSSGELEALTIEGIPASYAVIGRSAEGADSAQLVAFSPTSASDALFASLAAATAEGEAPFAGEVLAVAPEWSAAAQRQLSLLRPSGIAVRAVTASNLAEGRREVQREVLGPIAGVSAEQVAGHLANPVERALFARAAAALDGLAGKHGGSIRGRGRQLELVVMARRAAVLHARDHGVFLETILPQRSETRLDDDELAGALDRLEGHLRKRLNDRKVRDGEDGLRATAMRLVASARSLRNVRAWPIGSADPDVIDAIAVDSDGCPVAVVVRSALGLETLAEVIDAVARLRPSLPVLLGSAEPPVRFDALRLLVAAEAIPAVTRRVLAAFDLECELFEIQKSSRGLELTALEGAAAISVPHARSSAPPAQRSEPTRRSSPRSESADDASASASEERSESREDGEERSERGGRNRSRRRGRRGRGRAPADGADEGSDDAPRSNAAAAKSSPERMESISFFDLDDARDDAPSADRGRSARSSADEEEEGGGADRRRRRGGRGRRRGRRGGGEAREELPNADDSESEGSAPSGASSRGGRSRTRERLSAGDLAAVDSQLDSDSDDDDSDDVDDDLSPFVDDLPDFDEVQIANYDDDEESDGEEETEWRTEREKRRLARRGGKGGSTTSAAEPTPEPEEKARIARKRAALLVHADRESLMAGILLARDLRLLEGIWVYPQEDLMTFFRSVTPDLRDDTPIHVIGFTPSPAFEVLQTASLYSSRLAWYDHRSWAPEDEGALRNMLGEANLALSPGAGSVIPAVLSTCSRRSRFTDKLVDLATGRFTQHDYERWGRLWWAKLAEIAQLRGDRRADVDPLLVGRPSELARDAARVPPPEPPSELQVVASTDYRVVYFAGYSMVIAEVEGDFDPYLIGRIARERYAATLSLVYRCSDGLVILAGDELGSKRSLDTGAVADHLSQKINGVHVLADDDHVSRLHVKGLGTDSSRLDAVISEIAMGRSILEG